MISPATLIPRRAKYWLKLMEAGGQKMTPKQISDLNMRLDMIDLINVSAWPHGGRIVDELLKRYDFSPKLSTSALAKPALPSDTEIAQAKKGAR